MFDVLSIPLWFLLFIFGALLFAPSKLLSFGNIQGGISYFYWGFVFITLLGSNLSGIAQYMLYEQSTGTLEQFFLAPSNRLAVIAGRWARILVVNFAVLSSTTLFLFASAKTTIILHDIFSVFALLVLLELALLGIGLILAGLSLIMRSIVTYLNYVWIAAMFFSGVFFPPSSIHYPLEIISLILPTTYYVDLIKFYALGTQTIFPVGLELALVVPLSVGLLLGGLLTFNKIEMFAKRRGVTLY